MVRKCSRVAVIGAGPAGAIVTDALIKEHKFDTVRVFERKHVAGGTWYGLYILTTYVHGLIDSLGCILPIFHRKSLHCTLS